jgi:myo-inositol-1-phosphate synthase
MVPAGSDAAITTGLSGPVRPAAAYFCKHPMEQMTDDEAWIALNQFIRSSFAEQRSE